MYNTNYIQFNLPYLSVSAMQSRTSYSFGHDMYLKSKWNLYFQSLFLDALKYVALFPCIGFISCRAGKNSESLIFLFYHQSVGLTCIFEKYSNEWSVDSSLTCQHVSQNAVARSHYSHEGGKNMISEPRVRLILELTVKLRKNDSCFSKNTLGFVIVKHLFDPYLYRMDVRDDLYQSIGKCIMDHWFVRPNNDLEHEVSLLDVLLFLMLLILTVARIYTIINPI